VKVLITGCGGYIGTTLTPYLLRNGYNVRCIDWLIFGDDTLSHVIGEKGFELVRADVRDVDASCLRDVDAIIDMAAIPNDPTGELLPDLTWEVNFKARVRIANLAKKHHVSRYILVSSASVYGRKEGLVDESSDPNPLTVYARANLEAERSVIPLADKDFTVIVARLSTVYGVSRRMRFDLVVNTMTLTAYLENKVYVEGDGMQYRPLIHVVDVARALKLLLEAPNDRVNAQVFNVGSNEQNYMIIDIAREVSRITGATIVFRGEVDKRSYRLSFNKIRETTGFTPLYTIQDAIKHLYNDLLAGIIKPEDRWFTVKWYKKLIEEKILTTIRGVSS
jgi:nucleoside-diphosphate-sugar epimerase